MCCLHSTDYFKLQTNNNVRKVDILIENKTNLLCFRLNFFFTRITYIFESYVVLVSSVSNCIQNVDITF